MKEFSCLIFNVEKHDHIYTSVDDCYQSYRTWLHVLAKNFQTINKSILHAEDIMY